MNSCLSALLFLALLQPLATAGTLYGLSSSNPGVIYTISTPGVPVATPVATINGITTGGTGLEAYGDRLFATNVYDYTSLFGSFVSIDPQSGATTKIIDQDNSWDGLAGDPSTGFFYTVRRRPADQVSELLRVSATGGIVVVGEVPNHMKGLAFIPSTGLLYGVSNATLYSIDPFTAAMVAIGGHTAAYSNAAGLAFDADLGVLLLSAGSNIHTVSILNGGSAVAGYGAPSPLPIDALAYMYDADVYGSAVPEPATFLVAGVALIVLSALRLRRVY